MQKVNFRVQVFTFCLFVAHSLPLDLLAGANESSKITIRQHVMSASFSCQWNATAGFRPFQALVTNLELLLWTTCVKRGIYIAVCQAPLNENVLLNHIAKGKPAV